MGERAARARYWITYYPYFRKLRRYSNLDAGMRIADVGCGSGFLTSLLEHWLPNRYIVGLDYDHQVIKNAGQRASNSHFTQGILEYLPFKNTSMDVVFALHVVEHLHDPGQFFLEAYRVLKPGGILFVASPNPNGIGARIMKKNWSGWRSDHVSVKSPSKWIQLIEETGFLRIRSGTTGLSGMPIFRKLPLAIVNYVPLAIFGTFPWKYGEAFVGVFKR